ncbi:MAG: PucR family transcriptional regulator, partial [Solirubrobacteraceae bacterium]
VAAEVRFVLMGALWEWTDEISVTLASAHRRVELARARSDEQLRARFIGGVISGGVRWDRLAEEARAVRLDPDAECVIVRARSSEAYPPGSIERTLLPAAWSPGVATLLEDDVVAVLPAVAVDDAASWPFPAGVGPAAPLGAGERSFRLATRLLEAGLALSLSGPCRITDVGLRLAVLGEPDLTAVLRGRYIDRVLAEGDFGTELLASLTRYLEHEQNVDAAAATLHVHPNTLRHRLARYEQITGARLRNPEQFAEIWWAIQDSVLRQSRPRATTDLATAAPAAASAPTGRH